MKMNAVGKTSLLVAAMRARESERSEIEGRFFVDPYAELLAGPEGFSILQRALTESGDQPAIAVRTHFMDQKLTKALQEGVRQIVILAAGMDARAYRLEFPKGTKIFELDRQEVLNYKHEKLSAILPNCERIPIAVDLLEDWTALLEKAGFEKQKKTLWFVEGLLMYLEEAQARALFGKINLLASSNDILLCDILGQSLLESPFMQKQLQFLKDLGAPWKFGTDEPEEFMKSFSWKATATLPGEFAPNRWPFPVPPRHIPNVPRSFFIEAHKI